MATEFLGEVRGGRLTGKTGSDAETLNDMEGGTYRVVCTVPRGRSLDQLALWHGMCGLIAENAPGDLTKDQVHHILKIECGAARPVRLPDGTYYRVAKSIAFNQMPAPEFGALLDRAFGVAAAKFGPALSDAVRAELDRMAAGEPRLRVAA